ncbi:MAG: M23 family metallopeptidase, partial [Anaerolineae bacterium]
RCRGPQRYPIQVVQGEWELLYGMPVHAACGGEVIVGNDPDGYGLYVLVTHEPWQRRDQDHELYAHLSRFRLPSGCRASAGAVIGDVGYSGHCEPSGAPGTHLHWEVWRGGQPVDPLAWLESQRGEEMAQIWPHIQGHGYEDWLVDHARRLGGVKLLNPRYGDWRKFVAAGIPVVGRIVAPDDVDKSLLWHGDPIGAAELWFWEYLYPQMDACPGIRIWEGPNEPVLHWSPEGTPEQKAIWLNAFTVRLAELVHACNDAELVGFLFSTGHPDFALWRYFGEALGAVDYLGRHAYSRDGSFAEEYENLYRVVRDIQEIRSCGYRVPPVLETETGVDVNAEPETGGWHSTGLTPEQYVQRLVGYARRLGGLAPEVLAVAPFTWASTGWPSYDHGRGVSDLIVAEVERGVPAETVPEPMPEPPVDIVEMIRREAAIAVGAAYEPTWAFTRAARAANLGAPLDGEVHHFHGYAYKRWALGITYAPEGKWDKVKIAEY